MVPGLQLYTVREYLEQDLRQTLRHIANLGFQQLELFDISTLEQTVNEARDLGMKVEGTHFLPGLLTGNWMTVSRADAGLSEKITFQHLLDECARMQIPNIGIAILFPEDRQDTEAYRRFADLANVAGEEAQQRGIQLYYHHHNFEFDATSGTKPFDLLLDRLDPKLVRIELDVFWCKVAGEDPVAFLERLGRRCIKIHLKDLAVDTPVTFDIQQVKEKAFQPLGSGCIDLASVISSAKRFGITHFFIEQDHHTQGNALDNINQSLKHLQQIPAWGN